MLAPDVVATCNHDVRGRASWASPVLPPSARSSRSVVSAAADVTEKVHFGRAAERLGIAQPPYRSTAAVRSGEKGLTLREGRADVAILHLPYDNRRPGPAHPRPHPAAPAHRPCAHLPHRPGLCPGQVSGGVVSVALVDAPEGHHPHRLATPKPVNGQAALVSTALSVQAAPPPLSAPTPDRNPPDHEIPLIVRGASDRHTGGRGRCP